MYVFTHSLSNKVSNQDRVSLGFVAFLFWAVENGV